MFCYLLIVQILLTMNNIDQPKKLLQRKSAHDSAGSLINESPFRSYILTRDELSRQARVLAEKHQETGFVFGKGEDLHSRFERNTNAIEMAYYEFAESARKEESLAPGAEWLLDNYHVIEQQVRIVRKHLPKVYYRSLPKLKTGSYQNHPRIYELIVELLSHTDAHFDSESLSAFVSSYQSAEVLRIGELWAIPIMLKLGLVENLRRLSLIALREKEEKHKINLFTEQLLKDPDKQGTEVLLLLAERVKDSNPLFVTLAAYLISRLRLYGQKASLALHWFEARLKEKGHDADELIREQQHAEAANQISIGNTVTSLKNVSSFNWRKWFESVSMVDRILSADPAGFYLKSDFSTRDHYRRKIEELARVTGLAETEIAGRVVERASEAASRISAEGNDPTSLEFSTKAHVGYYLMSDAEQDFEHLIGYRAPPGLKSKRFFHRHAFAVYSFSIIALTAFILLQAAGYATRQGGQLWEVLFIVFLLAIPASEFASNLIQWIVTHLTQPFVLAKREFKKEIPSELKTVVTVHTIFKDKEAIKKAVELLEVRFLGNQDSNIHFALLADLADAEKEQMAHDEELIGYTKTLIAELNSRYSCERGKRFLALFRKRQWNSSERRFMGWERKRGKVMEFNRLVSGEAGTSFVTEADDHVTLEGVRYVITLDVDSQLPRRTAQKLIATISHPLNLPVFNESKRVVEKGYAIIQPRVGVALTSANTSRFSRIFTGPSGLDPYTQTVSDVYQDLFAEGSYIGKAIYDVRAFERALSGRVPENALLSHDLFEGLFARVALATDIELFDDFPSKYNVYAKRQHRWVRGDWQLFPWIFRKIPDSDGKSYSSPLSNLARWKLIDNLRRSLVGPACFLFLLAAWLFFSGSALLWSLVIMVIIAFPVYANIANVFIMPPLGLSLASYVRGVGKDLARNSKQALLLISFLPYQTYLMLDAVVVTLYRVYVSRRNLLEWQTAYYSERLTRADLTSFMLHMAPGTLIALASLGLILFLAPGVIWLAAPFILLWLIAPILASGLSKSIAPLSRQLKKSDREYLQEVAFETWLYFDQTMLPERNYLVPDNIQIVPKRVVAERTSATNIGLSLMSTVAAVDLGFIPFTAAVSRLSCVCDTLDKLEKFHGHFFNWYDTRSLVPLSPRYVSTVDSGNLTGHMIAVKEAIKHYYFVPFLPAAARKHLLYLLQRAIDSGEDKSGALVSPLETLLGRLSSESFKFIDFLECSALIKEICEHADFEVLKAQPSFKKVSAAFDEYRAINKLIDWYPLAKSVFQHFERLPSNTPGRDQIILSIEGLNKILSGRSSSISLLGKVLNRVKEICASIQSDSAGENSLIEFNSALGRAEAELIRLSDDIGSILRRMEGYISQPDYSYLFDEQKQLFFIGYNLDTAKHDSSYYDLLASEANLTSLIAIARSDVPQRHWFMLGRTLTDSGSGKALLSWGGTMFEYLMPLLVIKDFSGTVLSESFRAVVKAQRRYGDRMGVPWGVSESGYSGVDFEKTYQYKAFGVPGLGLKRGLSEDLVVSPYSSFLALPIDLEESLTNIRRLEREGLRGQYGFYEAIDYTPERLTKNEKGHIVKAFLAHHQGMILVSIVNILQNGVFQERFHSDPSIQSTELLLHEKFPDRIPAIVPHQAELTHEERIKEEQKSPRFETYLTPHTKVPLTHLLSNGHYSLMVDNSGSGYSSYQGGLSLTRWEENKFQNDKGSYIYLRDLDNGKVWSTAYQPTATEAESYDVIFNPEKIEFIRRDDDILCHTEITVSPEDDVEIRKVTLTNFSNRKRHIELTSYAEVALAGRDADKSHPAFSKLFIESEFNPNYDALFFVRRPRSISEKSLAMFHMLSMKVVWEKVQYETSRFNFLGRGNGVSQPRALSDFSPLSGTTGLVLDPVMSLRARVELSPGKSEFAVFVTGFSDDAEKLRHTAELYREVSSIQRAFEMAWSQSNVEIRHEGFTVGQTHAFQRLGNAIIFQVEEKRGREDIIRKNKLTQSGFWRFGISGDFPIVFLRVSEPGHFKLVKEVSLAKEYLRQRGLIFDLIILNEYPGGYFQDFQEELSSFLRHSFAATWLEKPGGIYLRTSTQLSKEEVNLIQAVARVVLKGTRGSLSSQLKFDRGGMQRLELRKGSAKLPALQAKGFSTASELKTQLGKVDFYNGLGGFTDGGRSYSMIVGQERLPPLPWINVVSNPKFGCLISEKGGGYTWSENSREHRLTPWRNDPVTDELSEAIYIRDMKTNMVWSPTPGPIITPSAYLVKHGFGYTDFHSKATGVESELRVSVSQDKRLKLWAIKLRNTNEKKVQLELFIYVDWLLGEFKEKTSPHIITAYDDLSKCIYAYNNYSSGEFAGRNIFLGSSLGPDEFTTDHSEFLGRNRNLSAPAIFDFNEASEAEQDGISSLAQKGRKLSGRLGAGFEHCGVIAVNISLEPGEEIENTFFMGEASDRVEMQKLSSLCKENKFLRQEQEKIDSFWRKITDSLQIQTPDRSFDVLMNGWLLYQTLSCRIFGRSALYQSGGAFGFRDQLQDSLSFLFIEPGLVRQQILLHASRQFPEGDVQHWWHPPTGKGVRTRITDDLLWLPYAVDEYLKVTSDYDLLEIEVPFIEAQSLKESEAEIFVTPNQSSSAATVYQHCLRAIEKSFALGRHGLPLMGGGDWNDGMNEVGREGQGESVWLGWFLYDILKRFEKLAQRRGERDRMESFRVRHEALLGAIEQHGWDGEWYRRAYFDDGTPLGSKSNSECSIDSLSQSWSVISGGAELKRGEQAMRSVFEKLVDADNGLIRLLTPPFNKSLPHPGYIQGYLPGIRENGGQYTHAACWVIMASALLGMGQKAFSLFSMINPVNHTSDENSLLRYKGEPYVTCGDVYSAEPHQGRAGWSWYTGSSGWLYRVGLEHILGFKIENGIISIDPCIPSDWKEFRVTYQSGGKEYRITVLNPEGVQKGVTKVLLDGHLVPKKKIALSSAEKDSCEVLVTMGRI